MPRWICADLGRLKTLLFTLGPTLGPLLIPRLLSWYRVEKTKTITAAQPIRPVPRQVVTALNILFISAVIALLSTVPYFAPENIFTVTSSRLQTPNDVLFTRLALNRSGNTLTAADEILKPKLASMDSRLLYYTYGHNVLTNCPFCLSDEPSSYLYYALPSLLLPHLIHISSLGLSTSSAIADRLGNRWRVFAASLGLALPVVECYLIATYDWKANARRPRPEDYVDFFSRMRVYRGISIALADIMMAALLWLSSTNRMFVIPISGPERMETAMRILEGARGKLNAVGVLRNVGVRDEGLRRKTEMYWKREGAIMGEVMDDRDVVDGVRAALGSRIQVQRVEEEARQYAEGMTSWPQVQQAPHSDTA